jgi:UDP-N-acetylglucosamine--N-acetylmuramyl-(pentapeptide) pyrophosphoryl-undecaprenol N-acetylglucosamine transferase
LELLYVGEAGGMEAGLAARAGIPFASIATGQLRGRAPWVVARNLVRMGLGFRQSGRLLQEFRPDVVFLTGGYAAAPVALAAHRAHVPLLIYLPDLTPGKSIEATSRYATKVAVSFPEVAPYFGDKAVITGYPVRSELLTADKAAARSALGLKRSLPVLLVFGGSRGARSINRALLTGLPELLNECQVVHATGTTDWPEVERLLPGLSLSMEQRERYHVSPYLHEMVDALAAADLVVARAGAGTLGEFPAAGLPAIVVPYPYSGQHQDANAAYLAERGAAVMLRDPALSEGLKPAILGLLRNEERRAAMAAAMKELARPDAAGNIAQELIRLAGY